MEPWRLTSSNIVGSSPKTLKPDIVGFIKLGLAELDG